MPDSMHLAGRRNVAAFTSQHSHGNRHMAIDDLLDEHEQSERVLNWLRRNGAGLVGGLILGLGLILGWQWWKNQRQASQLAAGDDYQVVLQSLAADDLAQAQARLTGLEGTAYAALATLDVAKAQLEDGQRDAAIATLRAARSDNPALQQVIDRRLGRLLIDAGKAQEALRVLADADDAAGLELRGDAMYALGKRDEARKLYDDAMTRLDIAAPQRRLLELKLTDVGGSPAKPEARS